MNTSRLKHSFGTTKHGEIRKNINKSERKEKGTEKNIGISICVKKNAAEGGENFWGYFGV